MIIWFDWRPIITVIGALLVMLAVAMAPAMVIDLVANNPDWRVFATSGVLTGFTGLSLLLATRSGEKRLSTRQAMVLTSMTWLSLCFFSALPLYFSGFTSSFTDAFFEAMSGLTTTGATVLTGLDASPPGLLFWRSTLQWLGGLGIIVMAVAVLPMLQIGGMQVFKAEAFDTSEKILPRATQISASLISVFAFFTAACAIAYLLAGMSLFDAINHAMTTVATGGFSTHDQSFGAFNQPAVEWVAIAFMIIGSLPFLAYIQLLQNKFDSVLIDAQIKAFFILVFILCLIGFFIVRTGNIETADTAFRTVAFNTVSIVTGTGYASTNYGLWGGPTTAFFFIIMFIGGCAGSTSCGIKIFRFQLLLGEIWRHTKQILYPNGVFVLRYNGKKIDATISRSVISFFILYFTSFALLAIFLRLTGLDFLTAISASGSAISNVGPGLGPIIGPDGNYNSLNDAAKWLLSFGMLLGRLELFAILVLLLPRFWID